MSDFVSSVNAKRSARSRTGAARIVAVGGGKGGVGKSLLASNLAIAIGRMGLRVVVVDCDLGAPNLHTLFGVSPGLGLQAFFDREVEDLAACDHTAVSHGVSLISGAWGEGTANINHGQKTRLVNHLRSIEADVVVLDLGAGTSFNVLDLFLLADVRLLVMAPQLTSLQNGYTFLKDSVQRLMLRIAEQSEGDPAAARARQMEHFGLAVVGNLLHDDRDRRALLSMSRMIRDHLGMAAPVVACVHHADAIRESANTRRPILLDVHSGPLAAELQRIARAVMDVDIRALRAGRAADLEAESQSAEPAGTAVAS